MAANIIFPPPNQDFLLPPSLKEWLPEDHLMWFALDAVQSMDLRPFYANIRSDGMGDAVYDPTMMVALLVYSYAQGIRSSRLIEQLCECDLAFRVICGNLRPDQTTIARFRQHHESLIKGLFLEVLRLCQEAGLTKLGTIAIDGTKVQGNASLAANKTQDGLEDEVETILLEVKAKDAEEDSRHGQARGDEIPPELRDPRSRFARIQECLEKVRTRKRLDEEAAEKKRQERKEKEEATGKPLRRAAGFPGQRPRRSGGAGNFAHRME